MKVGERKKSRAWLRAIVISSALASTACAIPISAGEPVQRLGRTLGLGWGDGYHACGDSGLRLLQDLPPRSFPDSQRHRRLHGVGGGHRSGATFYDHFDAQTPRVHCDRCQASTETAPQIVIIGSEVLRGCDPSDHALSEATPDADVSPSVSPSLASPSATVAKPTDQNPVTEAAIDAGAAELMLPQQQHPVAKKTNQEPELAPPTGFGFDSTLFPLASTREDALSMPSPTSPTSGQSGSQTPNPIVIRTVPSRTPAWVRPTDLADVEVREAGQAETKKSDAADPSTADAPTENRSDSTDDAYALRLESSSQKVPATESQPAMQSSPLPSEPPPTRLVVPGRQLPSGIVMPPIVSSQVTGDQVTGAQVTGAPTPTIESPAEGSPSEKSLEESPVTKPGLPRQPAKSTGESREEASDLNSEADLPKLPKSDDDSLLPRPHRLGASTGTSASLTPRPLPPTGTFTGARPAEVQVNPFVARPTVELAERPSASSTGVIYQPSTNSSPKTR